MKREAHAEDDEQQAAEQLDRSGIGDHHLGDRRHAEGCDRREQPVTEDGTKTRGDARPEAPGRRPLDAKDIDRPNGRGYQHANAHAGKHQLDARKDDMRAGQQMQPIAAGRRGETNDWLSRSLAGCPGPGRKEPRAQGGMDE